MMQRALDNRAPTRRSARQLARDKAVHHPRRDGFCTPIVAATDARNKVLAIGWCPGPAVHESRRAGEPCAGFTDGREHSEFSLGGMGHDRLPTAGARSPWD